MVSCNFSQNDNYPFEIQSWLSSRKIAAFSLFASRFIYAANWFNLSPAVNNIGAWYGIPVSTVGLVFTFFLVGAGIFQIPAGMIASRIGPKRTSVIGLAIMSITSFLALFAPDFLVLILYRTVSGIGAAFFFSSALAVLSDLYPENITSMTWLNNACFNLGGGFGIVLMTWVTGGYGWISNSLLMGLLTVPFVFLMLTTVPASEQFARIDLPRVRAKMLDRGTWLLAIGFSGFWASGYEFPEFLKSYAETIGATPSLAGAVGSLALFSGLGGIVLTSWIKKKDPIVSSILMSVVAGIGIMLLPLLGIAGITVVAIAEGILFGLVSALEYVLVIKSEPERIYRPLRLGLFNSIQILFGSILSLFFTFLLSYGYTASWVFLGFCVIILLPAVLVERGEFRP